jgi:hypothetical protein
MATSKVLQVTVDEKTHAAVVRLAKRERLTVSKTSERLIVASLRRKDVPSA